MNTIDQSGKRQNQTTSESRTSKIFQYQQILIAVFFITLTIAAYKCVVLKAFIGDDHVHLVWLSEAVKDPSLVLRNFGSNWLYSWTFPQCYRPLISVFMFTDYLLWHRNAIGFHITNLVFHGLASLALYGCVEEVARWSPSSRLRLWPIFAAGTFALYPSHPEAVSWVTGRVDTIVTAFYLCSTYAWMVWRRTADRRFFYCSLICMLLSLASKEMAVTIPAALLLFEFLRPDSIAAKNSGQRIETHEGDPGVPKSSATTLISKGRQSLFATSVAWLILAAYFILRRVALGTFVGGYDNTLAVDVHLLIQHWSQGLNKFFVPINSYYMEGNAWLINLWTALTAIVYLSSATLLFKRKYRNQQLFFIAFAAVSFAPVYKLFDGMPDLEGSRFSYLASAPIAAVFAMGLIGLPLLFKLKNSAVANIVQMAVAVTYFLLAAYMLWLNNQPWMTAGRWVATLEKQFNQTMAGATPQDHFVYFNITNNYRGAYLARNATGDIGQNPHVDWKAVETDDKLYELGQTRESIASSKKQYHTYYWSESAASFIPISLPPKVVSTDLKSWNSQSLSARLKTIQGAERVSVASSGKLKVTAGKAPVMFLIDLSRLQPWQTDFIKLDIGSNRSDQTVDGTSLLPSLIVSNNLMAATQIPAIELNGNSLKAKQLLFGLRLLPSWFCGSAPANAVLVIPPQWSGLLGVTIPEAKSIMPRLERTSVEKYITDKTPMKYSLDVSNIDGAVGAVIQISKKNQFYTKQNSNQFEESMTAQTISVNGTKCDRVLQAADLNGGGYYQVRCWAVDKTGQRIGVGSDYLLAIVL